MLSPAWLERQVCLCSLMVCVWQHVLDGKHEHMTAMGLPCDNFACPQCHPLLTGWSGGYYEKIWGSGGAVPIAAGGK